VEDVFDVGCRKSFEEGELEIPQLQNKVFI
jgi:hypothetical protein